MKRTFGAIVLVSGILTLLVGLAMPATVESTTTTCYAYNCVESTYQVPNTGRTSAIGAGMFATVLGGALYFSSNTSKSSNTTSHQSSLAKRLNEQSEKSNNETSQDDNQKRSRPEKILSEQLQENLNEDR